MLRLRRGLERGGHSDERAIHREISGKGSEGEKEMQGEAEAEMCVCTSTCKWSACVCVCVACERKAYNPQHLGYPRGV